MKKHIEIILLALGTMVIILLVFYTTLIDPSILVSWKGFIMFAISYALIAPGMWILSEKIKEKAKKISIFIKVFTIIQCLAFARYTIACFFGI